MAIGPNLVWRSAWAFPVVPTLAVDVLVLYDGRKFCWLPESLPPLTVAGLAEDVEVSVDFDDDTDAPLNRESVPSPALPLTDRLVWVLALRPGMFKED